MSLTKTWSRYFQSQIRQRGRAYHLAGRVEQVEPEADEMVRAKVRGRQMYTVTIRGDGQTAQATCTCPSFASGHYCKHIWATLLDVQGNGLKFDEEDAEREAEDDQPSAATGVAKNIAAPKLPKARKRKGGQRTAPRKQPEWIRRLALLRPPVVSLGRPAPPLLVAERQVAYQIHPELSARHNGLVVELLLRAPTRSGWGRSRQLKINRDNVEQIGDEVDRELCSLIIGASQLDDAEPDRMQHGPRPHAIYHLPAGAQRPLLRRMIDTERCFVGSEDTGVKVSWDGEGKGPWELWLIGEEGEDAAIEFTLELRRGDQQLGISRPEVLLGGPSGIVIDNGRAAPFDDRGAFRWVQQFRDDLRVYGQVQPIVVTRGDLPRFLDRLYLLPQLPETDFPPGVGREELRIEPDRCIELHSPGSGYVVELGAPRQHYVGRVWFRYEEYDVAPGEAGRYVQAALQADTAAEPGEPGEADGDRALDDADGKDPSRTIAPEGAGHPDVLAGGNGETPVEPTSASASQPSASLLIRRDPKAEEDALNTLADLGFRQLSGSDRDDLLILPQKDVGPAVERLISARWRVRADRRVIRNPGNAKLSISSGIDWFELRGSIRYETAEGEDLIDIAQILRAAKAGQSMIELSDGSQGILPEQWLQDHGLLAALGELEGDHLRFKSSQAALLDALLAEQELEDIDDKFRAARDRIRRFTRVEQIDSSESFQGSLRSYQKEGLGWLSFLRWFAMGGILADDMGLGKTIQVLALVDRIRRNGEERDEHEADGNGEATRSDASHDGAGSNGDGRGDGDNHKPVLVVAPRSVVHNWVDEAERFTPHLKVGLYAGAERHPMRESFADHDLIVTSYGLLRRDITELRDHTFDMVVLDEAQAIKNPSSQGAKAARLIRADHRLALTGTPVENHLGDLWSIFEFLNPGMLGSGAGFANALKGGVRDTRSVESAKQAGQALRPFILRRTKKQVLDELPDKTEQTLYCEMDDEQRKFYDGLRQHYRGALLKKVDGGETKSPVTSGGNTMLVIEALLRLRQAACHPALIDPAQAELPSAKLDVLMDQLEELIDEGNKALVFSQFTSFLSLVRERLDEKEIVYEYLDGQTRNRRERVQRFQNDEKCPLFLISLKAGGLGLNLTAASYVFILDPWWNPAVEQQAIDRAHRIGQTQHVTAYRLICEDTVEQRIAELQAKKRQLADAIVEGQENLLRSLTREDLERLLS